jgi:hypothetical protein
MKLDIDTGSVYITEFLPKLHFFHTKSNALNENLLFYCQN